jgi:hypothetical protein
LPKYVKPVLRVSASTPSTLHDVTPPQQNTRRACQQRRCVWQLQHVCKAPHAPFALRALLLQLDEPICVRHRWKCEALCGGHGGRRVSRRRVVARVRSAQSHTARRVRTRLVGKGGGGRAKRARPFRAPTPRPPTCAAQPPSPPVQDACAARCCARSCCGVH